MTNEPTDPGFVAADRDGDGPVLVFTGDVTKDAVRRFQLMVPASQRPDRADLTAATFLSSSAIDLLRHLAARQARAGARLTIAVADPVVRHQLVATGITGVASVRSIAAAG